VVLQDIEVGVDAIVLDGFGFEDGVKVGPLLENALVVGVLRAGDYMEEAIDGVEGLGHILLLNYY